MKKQQADCPYYDESEVKANQNCDEFEDKDVLGRGFDFVLTNIQGEKSVRKSILPFRTELIERLQIKEGDILTGRPVGAGCPVSHCLEVYHVDYISGIIDTLVVGPLVARESKTKDISAYNMVAFEGVIKNSNSIPKIGQLVVFLPEFCMLRLVHTGMVNQILISQNDEAIVRIENIGISIRTLV
jgi:uncharacterized Fe-S cluster-containing protein